MRTRGLTLNPSENTSINMFYPRNFVPVGLFLYCIITGVNQKVLPVLSTETLLHIWLSTEYYGFRPSSTAVDTVS